ncbi:MAG: hypothetical protein IPM66_10865 [Acidobacteriota bacterium]|nr:MAG: hypothetical protein IPM66_10865 [Acidobacteriota bacterium]
MSQELSKKERADEKRKKILLGALLVVFLGVVYYQFFTEEETPAPPAARVSQTAAQQVQATGAATRPAQRGQEPDRIISQPLDLASMSGKGSAGAGTGRNIFVYPPPPPPPTPKPQPTLPPPPPPPVTLYSVNPSGVIARTGDFTLTLFGDKIPGDGKIFIEGREFPTTIASPTEAKAQVPANVINRAGNLGVQIRSQSDAKMFSNQLTLNVAEPPAPPYRYIGLIVSSKKTVAVLKSASGDDVYNVSRGDIVGKNWRIINITPQKIEFEDTNLKITHSVNFTGENG